MTGRTFGPAIALAALLPLAACGRFDARMELKEGNQLYKEGKFQEAIQHYEQVPERYPERVQAALNTGYAHMAQYRFGSKHEKDRELAAKAVAAYEEYLALRPADAKKERFPERPQIDEWIITLLVDAERFEEAISRLDQQIAASPQDPALLRAVASTYDKWGKPVRALEYFQRWAKLFPEDPAPWVAIAAYCWNMSYRQGFLMDMTERNRWVDYGMEAADRALQINPEHFEAITYKNLLLRERAKLRVDPDRVAALVAEAQTYLEQARAIRQRQKEQEEAEKAGTAPASSGNTAPDAT